ncbi:hypothetical protein CCAX7_15050 [Capsulimonas corticalis]|uniref:Uncharacterized protein n=1 Tax=Capsulimonas corticalis TaxID=2219043 RepID=A0A402CZB4_9BACT|nr:hypothetical protein CCAX7_15050 [Capsulimonas corticalis]
MSTDSNTDPYSGYGGQNGYYTDWEAGTASAALALLTYRYYDPAVGRFLTRDPMGYKGGANAYEYVGDGPTNSDDSMGTSEFPIILGGPAGGCLGAILGLSGLNNDPCNDDYNRCIRELDCLSEVLAATAAASAVAFCDGLTDGACTLASRVILAA